MKKSNLIKILQDEIEMYGDEHIKTVKVVTLDSCWERNMLSPTRKNKATGNRALMSINEFREFCKENPIESVAKKGEEFDL